MLLFSLPVMLICLPSLAFLYIAGELDGEKDYVTPLDEKRLIGLAYTDIREAYKYKMTDSIFRPDIIALGSSRIMQVKRAFINENYSFYNAGGAINNIFQFQHFLESLHYTPKMLLINIDQFYFNPDYQNQATTFRTDAYQFPKHDLPMVVSTFLEDLWKGKVEFRKVLHNEKRHIGLNAIINENGYAQDGTHLEKNLINNPNGEDYNFKDTFSRIDQGNRRFEYREHADSSLSVVIDRFLTECEMRKIIVIALIPPFAPAVYKKMADTGKYTYMQEVYGIMEPCFTRHQDCYLFDFTDITAMGAHNHDFIDGFHGSEVIYNMLIRKIIKDVPHLQRFFKGEDELLRMEKSYNMRHIRYHSI